MEILVRYLHNDMIKPYDDFGLYSVFGSVENEVLIIDTTLRSFIPTQVHNITPRLRQIFRCDIFIVTKDMHIDLNIFRKNIETCLQQDSTGIHTYNSS